ncbi:BON domain-containing protein [Ramlibacter albus]|uniref:BON domain-containing protein n=1 Tax=Ramlibacter albus TaxID=2079448 RepID=A0A923M7G9_9BURK|nr:BON domain-containing protein [Ramlibacter albus]MBC5765390.1 BON domain-containing protein [Ramlibacter albus]
MRPVLVLAVVAALAGCGERAPQPKVEPTQVMGAAPQLRDAIDDTGIVTTIKRALLADGELGQFVIDVDSKDGYVVLSGVAPSEQARERATEIARHIPQVGEIANQLTVKQG